MTLEVKEGVVGADRGQDWHCAVWFAANDDVEVDTLNLDVVEKDELVEDVVLAVANEAMLAVENECDIPSSLGVRCCKDGICLSQHDPPINAVILIDCNDVSVIISVSANITYTCTQRYINNTVRPWYRSIGSNFLYQTYSALYILYVQYWQNL